MNKSYEVEYCNLELRFNRRYIQDLIKDLIQDGYSLYWSENDSLFVVSVRTGRKLVKLRFVRTRNGYKMVGDYIIRDVRLAEWMEKLIEDTKGHAIVKRFKDRQILIESILFGEVIRLVEISGYSQKVLYQKGPMMTEQEILKMFSSREGEQRLKLLRLDVDDELERLFQAMEDGDEEKVNRCKENLAALSRELMKLEW
ncbi:hypothetical protein [Paenibacillus pini]|uniref:Uncharacterized protein n=1 Tax=Paenibacillus pini JCM 16418 TaxID=1236976 RepID=W7YF75_9BACL|nr:hypothetical protein [Paenibacillus pini]GAF07142.1 hypothetical protein JCM16418_1133 [Paenibacillus pini JCM 16418]